jgi:hypothetical protein
MTIEDRQIRARSRAARALRAIPSEARAQASRENGQRGGRPLGHPVRVIPTTDHGMGDSIGEECPLVRDRASSRSGAIRAARRAGYRVMEQGGEIALHEPAGEPAEWWVTVHV